MGPLEESIVDKINYFGSKFRLFAQARHYLRTKMIRHPPLDPSASYYVHPSRASGATPTYSLLQSMLFVHKRPGVGELNNKCSAPFKGRGSQDDIHGSDSGVYHDQVSLWGSLCGSKVELGAR